VNNSSYAQTYIPLPSNNLINGAGDYNLDSLMTPTGTLPAPPTTIQVDISKVNYSTDVHIGTNMTNPAWVGLPTGYQMSNGYSIYSSYVRPLITGPYDVVGDQGGITSTIQFIAMPQIRFLSNGSWSGWQDIGKNSSFTPPDGTIQAEVRLPEWFTYSGSNLGSNALILNVVTLIGTGNQSLYTLTQSGNYECQMMDGYSPNGVNAVDFQLMFPVKQFTITTQSNPSNGGTTSGGGQYAQGTSCTVNATANLGYQFTNWTENSTIVSTSANYTFTVSGSSTLVANFAIKEYTLTVNNGTGSGSYVAGASVPITANTAPNGKTFDQWTGDISNVADINAASTTYTMGSTNATVTATYKDVQRSHKYLAYSITNNTVNVQIVGAEPGETYTLTVVVEELGKENISVQVTHKGTQQWEFLISNNKMHHLRAQYGTTILEAWIQKQ
jgi:hypothetical protein